MAGRARLSEQQSGPRQKQSPRQPGLWATQKTSVRPSRPRPPWALDQTTRQRGRRGVARARQALAHQEPEQLALGIGL
ncbi:MAG: hypothetical protein ACI8TP_000943 [Acidimicrobiales bacterium]|jgi:hypothetical protein